MPFIFDGVTITNVIFNGTEITELIFDGVTVFTSTPLQQTSKPEIESQACISISGVNYISYYVRNNDASTATIYAEVSDSTPDVNQGTVLSGQLTSEILVGPYPSDRTFTIYAKAQASGESLSTADIESVSTTFCFAQ